MALEQPPAPSHGDQVRALLAQGLPGFAAVAVFLMWAHSSGGYYPEAWYAGALFLAALLLVVLVAWPGLLGGLSRAQAVALIAFAGFTVWSYASIGWADVKSDAWDGANQTALYLIVFALFAFWRWDLSTSIVLLGGFAVGVSSLGLFTLVSAGRSSDPGAYYNDGRFLDPVGYVNGNAALFLLAFWPALFLASRRELPTLLRPLFLASAGAAAQLAVLPQSRGAAIAFALVLIVYLAVVPNRIRSVVFLLPVGVALAAGLPRLLEAGSETTGRALAAGARSAAAVVAISALSLFAVGLLLALADRRLTIAPRARRIGASALVAGLAAALVTGIVLVAASGDATARARQGWEELRASLAPESDRSYLLSGLETNRPDLWRVAIAEFRRHPVRGIGVENYRVPYVRHRRSDEETRFAHSFPLQVLAQTGLVGAMLVGTFLAAALFAAFSTLARRGGLARGASAMGIVIFAYWLVHGSIEWFWELPALAAPALAFLALAGSLGSPAPDWPLSRPRRLLLATVAALIVAASVSFLFPWLAARQTLVAISVWRSDPAAAAAAVESARRLNPLSERADVVAGSIARRRQDWDAMAAAYERVLERNPHSWYAHLQLALAQARRGRRAEARNELEAARRLNPSEPLLRVVSGWLARGEPVDVAAVTAVLFGRYEEVTR